MVTTFETLRTERVLEGSGALQQVVAEVARRGFTRVLVVSGRSISMTDEYAQAVNLLGEKIVGVEASVRAHNPLTGILELAQKVRELQVECIVSVGGGSPVDAAKLAALCVSEGIDAREKLLPYTVSHGLKELDQQELLPVLAVPTTLSAAEWNGVAAFVDEQTQTKELVRYVELTPMSIFLDPELCSHTPRDLWVQTGVRAIDHAVETILSPRAHPVTTSLALGALEILATTLKHSGDTPADYDAALQCQRAAWMSLQGVHNVPMGLSHAIGHQLGAVGIPHGATSSIVLPHVLRLYEDANPLQQQKVAEVLARARGANTPLSASDEMSLLFNDLGAPRTIREFDVPREALEGIAQICMKEAGAALSTSVKTVTYSDVLNILEGSYA